VVLSQDHNAGRVPQEIIYNSSCERVEYLKNLGTTIPDHTSNQQEMLWLCAGLAWGKPTHPGKDNARTARYLP